MKRWFGATTAFLLLGSAEATAQFVYYPPVYAPPVFYAPVVVSPPPPVSVYALPADPSMQSRPPAPPTQDGRGATNRGYTSAAEPPVNGTVVERFYFLDRRKPKNYAPPGVSLDARPRPAPTIVVREYFFFDELDAVPPVRPRGESEPVREPAEDDDRRSPPGRLELESPSKIFGGPSLKTLPAEKPEDAPAPEPKARKSVTSETPKNSSEPGP
ncbi:MAG: hypothetical protein ACRC1K_21665 [Planctomycetia bacterium]